MEKLKEYPEYILSPEKTLRQKISKMQETKTGRENLKKILDMSGRGIKAEDTEEFQRCFSDIQRRIGGNTDRARIAAIRYVWNQWLQS